MPVGQHGLLAICYVFLTPVKDTKKVHVYFLFLITRRYLHSNFIITLKEITEIPTEIIVGILELFIFVLQRLHPYLNKKISTKKKKNIPNHKKIDCWDIHC